MKLSQLNDWLSLIANLGVLVGLVVLIVEISQNTRAIDNEASWARVSTANDTYTLIIGDEEIASLLIKHGPNPNIMDEPQSPEIIRYRLLLEMIARQNEARFRTNSDDESTIRASLRSYLETPAQLDFYRSQMALFTPQYAKFVGSVIQEIEEN